MQRCSRRTCSGLCRLLRRGIMLSGNYCFWRLHCVHRLARLSSQPTDVVYMGCYDPAYASPKVVSYQLSTTAPLREYVTICPFRLFPCSQTIRSATVAHTAAFRPPPTSPAHPLLNHFCTFRPPNPSTLTSESFALTWTTHRSDTHACASLGDHRRRTDRPARHVGRRQNLTACNC